jgi:hypothetical protein
MKRFRVTFEMEVECGDYMGVNGEMYIRQDVEERFCGENVEVEIIEEN